MDKNSFIDLVFSKAHEKNIEEFEIYFLSGKNISLKVFKGKIESFSDNQNQGISFRGKFDGKMGYSYTESFEEEDADFLINEAYENGSVIESSDEQIIYEGGGEYIPVNTYEENLKNIEIPQIENFLINLEKEAYSLDKRIKTVVVCMFGMGESERIIKNSKGISLHDRGNTAYSYISVSAEENGVVKTGSDFKVSRDFKAFDYKTLAENAVKKAAAKLDTVKPELKENICIIENTAFTSLLDSMIGIFSAEAVQKKSLSF